MNNILNFVFKEDHLLSKMLFRHLIYFYYLWNSLMLIVERKHFFGENTFNYPYEFGYNMIDWLYYILWHPSVHTYSEIAIYVQVIFLLTGIIFNISNKWHGLLSFLLTMNVMHLFLSQLDGGHNITLLLFTFIPFINTSGEKSNIKNEFINKFSIILSKTFFSLSKFQVLVLYFSCVMYKLQGSMWTNGVAMYYIPQADEFFHPFWTALIINSDLLITALTYTTLLWEIAHPFLLLSKKYKSPMIVTAIFFHLGTVFMMGLTTFGVAMIIANLIFLEDSHIKYLRFTFDEILATLKKSLFGGFFGRKKINL